MIVQTATDRTTRRRKLEQDLGQLKFEPGLGPGAGTRAKQARVREFRVSLERMGPVFAAFGRYLSSRLDLVPETVVAELAAIPDFAPPAAASEVLELYSRELRCPVELAFRALVPEPFQARLFWQTHRAVLGDTEVLVKFIPPDIGRRIADFEFLNLLESPLIALGVDPAGARRAIADFQSQIPKLQTWEADLSGSQLLAFDAERFQSMGAPGLYAYLSTPHVAVWRRWQSLDDISGRGPDGAHALCTAWLRQTLQGSAYPVEVRPEDAGFAADARIVFPCGPFAVLPDALKASLWNYLLAVAADDTDLAATHLASAMSGSLTTAQSEQLRRRFRQTAPISEGFPDRASEAWPVDGRFSSQVLIHWRIANESNQMSDALITFYRGLFAVLKTATTLAPGRDWLAEAVRDLRLQIAFDEMRDAIRPSQVAAWMETNTELLLAMPERLDRALTYASKNRHPIANSESCEQVENGRVRRVSLLLALAAAALLLHKITAAGSTIGAVVAPVAFLMLGLLLLRLGTR